MSKGKRYELALKHEICRLYKRGGYSKTQLQNHSGITGKTTLCVWHRQLGYVEPKSNPELIIIEPAS